MDEIRFLKMDEIRFLKEDDAWMEERQKWLLQLIQLDEERSKGRMRLRELSRSS